MVAIIENLLLRRTISNKTSSGATDIDDIARKIEIIKAMLKRSGAIARSPLPTKINFTPREQSVLDLVAEGLMNKEIARR